MASPLRSLLATIEAAVHAILDLLRLAGALAILLVLAVTIYSMAISSVPPQLNRQLPAQVRQPIDADHDGLRLSLEQQLGTSDQHKDLFVVVFVGHDYRPLTSAEQAQLTSFWASMPVANPDGRDGIDVHVLRQVPLNTTPVLTIDESGSSNFDTLRSQVYTQRNLGSWRCRAHGVLLTTVDSRTVSGEGATPGHFAVVEGTPVTYRTIPYDSRVIGVTHELLHNVVGQFPDSYTNVTAGHAHTYSGVLSHAQVPGEYTYISGPTRTILSSRGFVTPSANTINAC